MTTLLDDEAAHRKTIKAGVALDMPEQHLQAAGNHYAHRNRTWETSFREAPAGTGS